VSGKPGYPADLPPEGYGTWSTYVNPFCQAGLNSAKACLPADHDNKKLKKERKSTYVCIQSIID
jgi:hypothetical protein